MMHTLGVNNMRDAYPGVNNSMGKLFCDWMILISQYVVPISTQIKELKRLPRFYLDALSLFDLAATPF